MISNRGVQIIQIIFQQFGIGLGYKFNSLKLFFHIFLI